MGREPHGIATGDFDADGKLDVAVACRAENAVTILLGRGNGEFRRRRAFPAGSLPAFVATGDLNEDGRADLVVAQHDGGYEITILLGDGRGAFRPAKNSPLRALPSSDPHNHGLLLADFNGDGHLDIVIANSGRNAELPDWSVSLLLGDGKGGFRHATGSPIPTGKLTGDLAVADFNGDGAPDLAATNEGGREITVLLNTGQGSFSSVRHFPIEIGRSGHSIALGDWNGDGRADAATTIDDSRMLVIWSGDGRGGFSRQEALELGRRCFAITTGRFNNDSLLDLAMSCEQDSAVVLLGNGAGGFAPAPGSPFRAGSNPLAVAAADLDGDGRADLIVSNRGSHTLTVLLAR